MWHSVAGTDGKMTYLQKHKKLQAGFCTVVHWVNSKIIEENVF